MKRNTESGYTILQIDPETNKVCGKAAAEVSITVKN